MRITYTEIKNNFIKYLKELEDPSIDVINLDTSSIFTYNTQFKNFLSEKYNISNLNISMDDVQNAIEKIQNENSEKDIEDTNITDEEVISSQDMSDIEGQDITSDKLTLSNNSYSLDMPDDDINTFFQEYLNDFIEDDSVKEIIDVDNDDKLSDEELANFFNQIAKNDNNEENLSFEDIQSAYTQIKDKTYIPDDTANSIDDNSKTPDADESSTKGTSGGGNGGNYNTGNDVTDNDNENPDTNNDDYSSKSLSELQTLKNEKQNQLTSSAKAISDIISGENAAVKEATQTAQQKKEEYQAALDADTKLNQEQKNAIKENEEAITQKQSEIDNITTLLSETQINIFTIEQEIVSINTTISALESSKSKLITQTAKDITEQGEINSNISAISAKITELTEEKNAKEEEKNTLKTQETEYQNNLTIAQQELIELQNKRITLNEGASDETKLALQNYESAETAVKTAKETQRNTALQNLESIKNDYKEFNAALSEKEANALKKEYNVGTPDLFTDDEYSIQQVTRDGMDYIVIGPKNADPNEELPVMVYLHGSGESGNDLDKLENGSFLKMIRNQKEELGETFNGYIIMPQSSGDWKGEDKLKEVKAIVNEFSQTHAIDRDNIAIAGHSLGAIGVTYMASHNEDNFFSKGLILSGYNSSGIDLSKVNIPVYGVSGTGENNCTSYIIKKITGNTDNYMEVKSNHGSVPRYALSVDRNNNNRSDLIEWLFPDYA